MYLCKCAFVPIDMSQRKSMVHVWLSGDYRYLLKLGIDVVPNVFL